MSRKAGPIVTIVGTRPEGIKVLPLYKTLKKNGLETLLCSTMQHNELLLQVFDIFNVKPDFNLDIMRHGQDLFYLTQSILQKTKELFLKINPSLVIVQGDTTSTMAAALSAFYLNIPVAHVEAGLRTDDIRHPFPEEMNRRVVSQIADYHFAPTEHAQNKLLAQGIAEQKIFCTGNTVVDALHIIQKEIELKTISISNEVQTFVKHALKGNKEIILLTTHRRESFNGAIEHILQAVKDFLQKHPNTYCFYPFHPNPHVIQAIEKINMSELENLHLCEPIAYSDMVYLISHANLVLTDSGGIQEEAVSLSKPVLVLREKTERMEGVWAGLAKLVGTDKDSITRAIKTYIEVTPKESPPIYGDGTASQKITQIIAKEFEKKNLPRTPNHKEEIERFTLSRKTTIQAKTGNPKMKKVCVLGLGYIGLPTSIVLAENDFDVTGFDIDEKKVSNINSGDPVIDEPEVYEKLQLVLKYGRFRASTEICKADYFIIAVPTPFKENKIADLSYVYKAAESLSKKLENGNVVLLESTIPVGATKQLALFLEEKTALKAGKDFYVAHCPERVLPGKIFKELIENDRVIGGINHESSCKASLLYNTFVTGNIHLTDDKTAEMVKLIENSSRDAQIAFAHQIASMANSQGINPYEVIELANKHPRVNILRPTCGVGGHCIAIDPWFLVESFPQHCDLIRAVRHVNDNRPKEIISIIKKEIEAWNATNKKLCNILLLGLTYKPDVDDLRESPALYIAQQMSGMANINLMIAEPHIRQQKLFELFDQQAITIEQGIQNADIVVYLVKHKRFKAIDKKRLKNKLILDFCGITYKEKFNNEKSQKSGMLDFFITNYKKRGRCPNNNQENVS